MESVAVMAVSVLSPPSTDATPETLTGSVEHRHQVLSDALAMKLRLGYEVESETEFGAVVFTPSPRRWLWTRTGPENPRLTIAIDEDGKLNMSKQTARN